MQKILIVDIIASSKIIKLSYFISEYFDQELPYTMINIIITHLLELQQKDQIAWTICKKLAILKLNVFFGELGKTWLKVKRIFYYNGKLYMFKTF